jgi:predicted metal-dependent hydrolase
VVDLVVRRPPFRFEGVDFIWNPDNRAFSVLANTVSFQVIGFERYICRSVSDAEKLIDDPEMLSEARLFRAQEMVHSHIHKRHVDVLVGRYPGLKAVLDESVADYEDMYRSNELRFNLAYAANIEATFAPMFSAIITHRERLMSKGDSRVASTFIWHFCEEMEHRRSALAVYDFVVQDSWYRFRNTRRILRHVAVNARKITEGFLEHVPGLQKEDVARPLARLSWLARTRLSLDLMASQSPWHDPDKVKAPQYYHEWRRRYEAGEDMTRALGNPPPE